MLKEKKNMFTVLEDTNGNSNLLFMNDVHTYSLIIWSDVHVLN